jgi:hypothetical protein
MPNWIPITDENKSQVKGWVDKARPGVSVAFKKPSRRTLDQNDMMWPYLRKIAKSLTWDNHQFDEYQWKDIFMNSLYGNLSVPGIQGGIVFVGSKHTSDLTKLEMSDLLEMIIAFAADHGIDLDD